ncbi:PepSY domain-containing protein [Terrarubrum flagellatum]|uniref:PepSY domain-containing protein n=1 Tax=Terrirubrum flagellatum TaxID=2895980 RepID=UPI00314560D8
MKHLIGLSFAAALLSTAAIAQTAPSSPPSPQPTAPAAPAEKMAPPMGSANEPATTGSTPSKPDANAPLAGANSFTQSQAKSRIEASGFSAVSELQKDEKGVWRGSATKDGKSMSVAVDFRGNVTSQ